MPCAEFEALLLDRPRVDREQLRNLEEHLAGCPVCRAFAEALERLDADLAATFVETQLSNGFERRVLRAVARKTPWSRPSAIPEILDFVGWAAVVAIIACLAFYRAALYPL